MPGPTNSTNRFGSSSYIVGTPGNGLGNGVNFTSIQAAINQALVDGYGVGNPVDIIIRAGVYVEDIIINDGGISLVGASSGSYNLLAQQTFIQGTLTLNVTGSNQFSLSNILVSGQVGPSLLITGGITPVRLSATNCSFINAMGFPAISMTNTSGTLGFAIFTSCYINGQECLNSSARTISVFNGCSLQGSVNAITLDGTSRVQLQYSSLTASGYGVQFLNSANQCQYKFSTITSDLAAVDMTPGGTTEMLGTNITSNDPSGFFVIGTGTFDYADVRNKGLAIGIDPGLAVIKVFDWKPYAEAGAAPGTNLARGTCSFDSSQFTVVDGFVQTSVGSFTWVEQNASTTVAPNQGNFTVAAITLTLPAQPQPIGTVCKFTVVTNDILNIAGNPGDFLQIANSGGTSVTSSASGDSVEFTHYDLGIWIANDFVGSWTVNP